MCAGLKSATIIIEYVQSCHCTVLACQTENNTLLLLLLLLLLCTDNKDTVTYNYNANT